jgi:hypothetical protein
MLSRALRPGVIFASLASADVPRRLASYFGSDRLFSRLLVSIANVLTMLLLSFDSKMEEIAGRRSESLMNSL